MHIRSNGLLHNFKYKIYNQVEGKNKWFAPKWDSLCKHVGYKKAKKNISSLKKGEWYSTKYYKHVKNHDELVN